MTVSYPVLLEYLLTQGYTEQQVDAEIARMDQGAQEIAFGPHRLTREFAAELDDYGELKIGDWEYTFVDGPFKD